MTAPFQPARGYRLNPDVALRPEPFGALAYHFGTRRLSFLKAPELVELVRGLGSHQCVSDAVAAVPDTAARRLPAGAGRAGRGRRDRSQRDRSELT